MTICNMSIEPVLGLINCTDEKTFDYINNRQYTPNNFDDLVEDWKYNLKLTIMQNLTKVSPLMEEIEPQVVGEPTLQWFLM